DVRSRNCAEHDPARGMRRTGRPRAAPWLRPHPSGDLVDEPTAGGPCSRGRPGTAQLLEDLAALALALRGGGEDPALALALVLAAALVRSGHVARALTRAL